MHWFVLCFPVECTRFYNESFTDAYKIVFVVRIATSRCHHTRANVENTSVLLPVIAYWTSLMRREFVRLSLMSLRGSRKTVWWTGFIGPSLTRYIDVFIVLSVTNLEIYAWPRLPVYFSPLPFLNYIHIRLGPSTFTIHSWVWTKLKY